MAVKKFLIGQLACYGDCLYATTVAKQIKHDFPDSHITWAVLSKYKSVLYQNPDIDAIWELEFGDLDYADTGWMVFEKQAKEKKDNGIFDELIFTQITPYWENYNGVIRSSILNGYKNQITVSVQPVLILNDNEIQNVKVFYEKNNLSEYKNVILFECSPGSAQSFVNINFAIHISERITSIVNDVCFILSSPKPLNHPNKQIIDASELTFRENAELTKYCTLFIGCSSGITWLCTSDWAKKIPMVQLLGGKNSMFAGVKYDLEQWHIATDHIIEITRNDADHIVKCLLSIFNNGFSISKQNFDENYEPAYSNFRFVVHSLLRLNKPDVNKTLSIITRNFSKRNSHFKLLFLQSICVQEQLTFLLSKPAGVIKSYTYGLLRALKKRLLI